jgi:hypothetical protein
MSHWPVSLLTDAAEKLDQRYCPRQRAGVREAS